VPPAGRCPLRITRFLAFPLFLIALADVPQVSAQELRGRVVDDPSRRPVPHATVTLLDGDSVTVARVMTDEDGFFRFAVSARSRYHVEVQQVGYAAETRVVTVGAGDLTLPAFVLRAQAIALDPIRAEVASGRDAAVAGAGRTTHLASGKRLARMEQYGVSMMNVIRTLNGPRTREYRERTGKRRVCVESARAVTDMDLTPRTSTIEESVNQCNWIALVIDGITIEDPELLMRTLNPRDFESIEYFSPGEAGSLFGLRASASGALVLWTRGRGPHVHPERSLR
jgi:hypothetical protein